jgi:hypothetical protein
MNNIEPKLEPMRDGEHVVELGRTSTSPRGWLAAVANVTIGFSSIVRIAAWNPAASRWLRIDLHPTIVRELAELLRKAGDESGA